MQTLRDSRISVFTDEKERFAIDHPSGYLERSNRHRLKGTCLTLVSSEWGTPENTEGKFRYNLKSFPAPMVPGKGHSRAIYTSDVTI
jgi:hypothetical protein